MSFKCAANLSMLFTEWPLRERVLQARIAGFAGVEIQFPYELPAIQLKEALAAADLPLVLINLPAGDLMQGGAGLAAVPERQAEFDQALQEALSYAAMVRPLRVNVLPGRLAPHISREHALQTLVANLRKAAQAFAVLGIEVLFEAINPLDMADFLINTPEQLLSVLAAVAHPNLKAQLDLYHMARQGIDPVTAITQLAGQIGHVQVADYPGRGAPGTAHMDFAAALAALRQVDYQGWIAAEYRPDEAGTLASLGWLQQGLLG